MSKETKLPEINIGLIGHVDHGKTTLTSALTGKWTMIHSEEMKRGITIKLGYADADIRKCKNCNHWTYEKKCPACKGETELVRKVSFVDAPGHETLMAVMISGAAIMDAAILVIAANDKCPQPQTQEHLMGLKILGIKNIIIVQNKIDLVTKAKAKANYEQIKNFAKKVLGFEVPIIPISAQKKVNITALFQAIQELFPTPKRNDKQIPMLLVARSFDVNKPGAKINKLIGGVIGGAISQGVFKIGQEIEIKPGLRLEKKGGQVDWQSIATKVTGISSGGALINEKGPGGTVALSTTLDPAVTKSDSLVGNVVGLSGKLPPLLQAIDAEINLFDFVVGAKDNAKTDQIKKYENLMISSGTATTLGVAQTTGKKIRFTLRKPIVAQSGDKIAIGRQIQGRWRLIGFGVIV